MSLICPRQSWYLPPCPTTLDFLSLLLSVHHLEDVRLLLFGMRVVMLVLLWPGEDMKSALQCTERSSSQQPTSFL